MSDIGTTASGLDFSPAKIIGFIKKGQGLVIHTHDCPTARHSPAVRLAVRQNEKALPQGRASSLRHAPYQSWLLKPISGMT